MVVPKLFSQVSCASRFPNSVLFGSSRNPQQHKQLLTKKRGKLVRVTSPLGAGFKSQRPHHANSGPIVELHYFRLLKILTSLNSQTYSKPASISFLGVLNSLGGCRVIIVVLEADELSVQERVLDVSVAEHFHASQLENRRKSWLLLN